MTTDLLIPVGKLWVRSEISDNDVDPIYMTGYALGYAIDSIATPTSRGLVTFWTRFGGFLPRRMQS
jgi:hypothetical protein